MISCIAELFMFQSTLLHKAPFALLYLAKLWKISFLGIFFVNPSFVHWKMSAFSRTLLRFFWTTFVETAVNSDKILLEHVHFSNFSIDL